MNFKEDKEIELLEGIDVNGNMKTIVKGFKKEGINYITKLTRETIEDNWNVAEEIQLSGVVSVNTFKTFIQKVKEDMNKEFITGKIVDIHSDKYNRLIDNIKEVMDKRTGDL